MPEKIDYRKQTPFKYWQAPESLWTDETAMVDAWIAYANAKA